MSQCFCTPPAPATRHPPPPLSPTHHSSLSSVTSFFWHHDMQHDPSPCYVLSAAGSKTSSEASVDNTALDPGSASGLYIFGGNTSTEFVIDGGGEEVPLLRLFFSSFISDFFMFRILTLHSTHGEASECLSVEVPCCCCCCFCCVQHGLCTWHCDVAFEFLPLHTRLVNFMFTRPSLWLLLLLFTVLSACLLASVTTCNAKAACIFMLQTLSELGTPVHGMKAMPAHCLITLPCCAWQSCMQ